MSLLNLNYQMLIYQDPDVTNPKVRLADITKQYQGITISNVKSSEIVAAPGETKIVASTLRGTTQDNTTELKISRPISAEDIIRLAWTSTGTAPAFRIARNIATASDTEIKVERVSPNSVRLSHVSGTAPNFAAALQGDTLYIERSDDLLTSPFAQTNQGKSYMVQASTATSIDFVDDQAFLLEGSVVLGADFDKVLKVFSSSPVKSGDKIKIQNSSLNVSNNGEFEIIAVTDSYVEYVNPYAIEQVFTNNSSIAVYDSLIGLVHITGLSPFKLKINDGSPFPVGTLNGQVLFLSVVSAWKLEIVNDGSHEVAVTVQLASVASM